MPGVTEKPSPAETSNPTSTSTTPTGTTADRSELQDQARAFLTSPLVADQPLQTKRQFLLEKGLSEAQVGTLLRQTLPTVPPPTYPRPSPSAIPTLLLGIFRVFSYAVGASSALLLVYYRFLLPRIIQTSRARLSLKQHQRELLHRLYDSITSLKEQQVDSFAILPQASNDREPTEFSHFQDVAKLVAHLDQARRDTWRLNIPHASFLRCAIFELVRKSGQDQVATEVIFEWLEEHAGFHENTVKKALWKTLSESPRFQSDGAESSLWSYIPPAPPQTTALFESMVSLKASLPPKPEKLPVPSPAERLMTSMTTLTGYLSASIYAPVRPMAAGGKEEEIRKEIRALKGLSLNRKSFAPPKLSSR